MSTLFETLLRGKSHRPPVESSDVLAKEQREMIEGIEDLSVTSVKEVMVPRTDTVFLPSTASPEEILDTVTDSGHSRIPVYGETIDDILGILYAKDLLSALHKNKKYSLNEIVRPPFFVPETKHIDSLLREFRRRHVHIAIAVDEYGGVSGIVCLEDILEQIVGEIQDEFDDETVQSLLTYPDGSILCEAKIDLDDLNSKLDLDLPEDDFDSLGGYVVDLFGRIPAIGESVESGGWIFTVRAVEGHRVLSILMKKKSLNLEDE